MALTMRQWRKARELTQAQMAERLNVHINTYQKWEKAPETISIKNSIRIAEILKVPMDEIVFQKEVSA